MKKAVFIISTLLLFSGCSLEEILDEIAPDMTAKIDGLEWKASFPYSALDDDKFIVTGVSLSGESISITINSTASGNYELSLMSAECAAIYKKTTSSSLDDAYLAISGNVTLTEVNTEQKTISGTFSFSVKRGLTEPVINITEGKFEYLSYSDNVEQQ
jgi:hypothetical protein